MVVGVPRLWDATIETHRAAVRDATLDAAAALVAEAGLTAVTMSQIATRTGIGRATLYKYFPDVESILVAWHERQVADHLQRLVVVRQQAEERRDRLAAVLGAYARILREARRHSHDLGLVELLHRDERIAPAGHRLSALFRDVLVEAVDLGAVRDDVPVEDLVGFCRHALAGAADAASDDGVDRLVALTLAAIRAPSDR